MASEDIRAREELIELLTGFGFVVDRIDIDPRRPWQPEASDLVAICGPKSSPTVAELLTNAPVLHFAVDDQRWTIKDRTTGDQWESPMDDETPRPVDVGYIGRIPFDAKRKVFVIAGVHAIGSLGAVHFLRSHLPKLYEKVAVSDFSMIVRSEHGDDGEIKKSEVACPPVLH